MPKSACELKPGIKVSKKAFREESMAQGSSPDGQSNQEAHIKCLAANFSSR
jgi:hypothetical protein